MSKPWRTDKQRRPRPTVRPFVDRLTAEVPEGLEWYIGGSWRRGALMIGDLDVVIITDSGTLDDDLFGPGVNLPSSFKAQRQGPKIAQGDLVLPSGESIHVDFWICTPKERGAFLMFITGPKELNVAQRSHAKKLGYSLSQVGLLDEKTKKQVDDGTEENIYELLGQTWIAPEQRQAFAAPENTPDTVRRRVKSSKGDGFYNVTVRGSQVHCTCPGFHYRQVCKHVVNLRLELGITGPITVNSALRGES